MIDHIPIGIIIADAPDVTIRAVSRFGLELMGRRDSAIIGIPADQHSLYFRMYHADAVTPARIEELPLTRATRQGQIVRDEVWVLGRPDGARVPILCAAGPIRDADGIITGGVMGWQDITERRRAEDEMRRSDEKYRSLIESIGEGFCIIEVIFDERDNPVDYRFLEVNSPFERHTGLTNTIGKTMRELVPDLDERLLEIYGRVARTGQPKRFENHAAQPNRWYDVYAWRYGRQQERQVAILFNDITTRKEAELRAKPDSESQS
jgi:PAS domain S-box-containing protein